MCIRDRVKIDPKSIGVGQYQHDMNQKKLGEALGGVVEDLSLIHILASAGLVSLLYGVLGGSEVAVKILVDVFLFFISFMIQRQIVYR